MVSSSYSCKPLFVARPKLVEGYELLGQNIWRCYLVWKEVGFLLQRHFQQSIFRSSIFKTMKNRKYSPQKIYYIYAPSRNEIMVS